MTDSEYAVTRCRELARVRDEWRRRRRTRRLHAGLCLIIVGGLAVLAWVGLVAPVAWLATGTP